VFSITISPTIDHQIQFDDLQIFLRIIPQILKESTSNGGNLSWIIENVSFLNLQVDL